MSWYAVLALGAVVVVVLYLDFRRRHRSRNPAVDAFFATAALATCVAFWRFVPSLVLG